MIHQSPMKTPSRTWTAPSFKPASSMSAQAILSPCGVMEWRPAVQNPRQFWNCRPSTSQLGSSKTMQLTRTRFMNPCPPTSLRVPAYDRRAGADRSVEQQERRTEPQCWMQHYKHFPKRQTTTCTSVTLHVLHKIHAKARVAGESIRDGRVSRPPFPRQP